MPDRSRLLRLPPLLLLLLSFAGRAEARPRSPARAIDEVARHWQVDEVPSGALIVLVRDRVWIRRLGRGEPGRYELASSSKAFTGMLVALLAREGRVSLSDPVTKWVPELGRARDARYAQVTIRHLLEHRSGLPSDTLDLLRPNDRPDALSSLPELLADVPLTTAPGSSHHYASLNYDLLGLVAQQAGGRPFAVLLRDRIFLPLGMTQTRADTASDPKDSRLGGKVQGYKISFANARPFDAPRYLQNAPAGYVSSTPEDMARWLRFLAEGKTRQAKSADPQLAALLAVRRTMLADMPTSGKEAYLYGWDVEVGRTTVWEHPGQNPNATAYVGFDPNAEIGVALMGNSNSPQVPALGEATLDYLRGTARTPVPSALPVDTGDQVSTWAALLLWAMTLATAIAAVTLRWWRAGDADDAAVVGNDSALLLRQSLLRSIPTASTMYFLIRLLASNLVLAAALLAVPSVATGFGWASLLVWGPDSLVVAATGVLALFNALAVFTRRAERDDENGRPGLASRTVITKVIGLTAIAGLLNSALVLLLIEVIDESPLHLLPNLVLIAGCVYFYIAARRSAELQIMRFGHLFVQARRMGIINRLLSSSHTYVQRLSPGKIQSVVGEDAQELARSMLACVPYLSNLLTIFFLVTYLTIFRSAIATVILLTCALPMIVVYYHASRRAGRLMPEVLEARSDFLDIVEDLQKGYKSLRRSSIRRNFQKMSGVVSDRYMGLRIRYDRGFLNAFFIGETLLIALLAAVALFLPSKVPDLDAGSAKDYLIVLLYLIGPLNAVMGAMPELTRLRGLAASIGSFNDAIVVAPNECRPQAAATIRRLELHDVRFAYPPAPGDDCTFSIGPVAFAAERGKAYFLTGGNGSGKSTLGLILAGLVAPDSGAVCADGQNLASDQLLETTRAVFNDNWLSKRIYDPDLVKARHRINENLALLGLAGKTAISEGGAFTTIDLSTGQRKRLSLALLLADASPVVLLDEWAAEQDAGSKRAFYRDWLPILKAQGRIIFLISHDDEYFSEADAILTMKDGRMVSFEDRSGPTDPFAMRLSS